MQGIVSHLATASRPPRSSSSSSSSRARWPGHGLGQDHLEAAPAPAARHDRLPLRTTDTAMRSQFLRAGDEVDANVKHAVYLASVAKEYGSELPGDALDGLAERDARRV